MESSKRGLNVVERARGEVMELETMSNLESEAARSPDAYIFLSTLYMLSKSTCKKVVKKQIYI